MKIDIMHDKELKACPFCGEKPIVYSDKNYGFIIKCPICDCVLVQQFTSDMVIIPFEQYKYAKKAWNKRVSPVDRRINKPGAVALMRKELIEKIASVLEEDGGELSKSQIAKKVHVAHTTVDRLMPKVIAEYDEVVEIVSENKKHKSYKWRDEYVPV